MECNILANKKILLVNDSRHLLSSWSSDVLSVLPDASIWTAESAYEAEALIRECQPALVVLDVTLPETQFNKSFLDLEGDDVARFSSRVAHIYKGEVPDGRLIVASTYAPSVANNFPPDSIIVDAHNVNYHNFLKSAISDSLGLPLPSASELIPHGKSNPPVNHRSRIRAVREGLFHHDPDDHFRK